jgi:tetratricopeptide (TPR) repeat protein
MRVVVIAVLLLTSQAVAQPTPPTHGPTQDADPQRAKELYQSAEVAMAAQDYETAARDYGAAYEISHDPVLFYKIGTANERAGKCPLAVIYYRRYIAEGKPTPAFADITNARIKACDPDAKPDTKTDAKPDAKTDAKTDAKADAKPDPKPDAAPAPVAPPDGNEINDEAKPEPSTAMGAFVGSKDKGGKGEPLTARNRAAWLCVTGSIALITVGAVLAYSADSAEQDIKDLYVGLGSNAPVFDRETKAIYEDMIAQGQRYERLSWLSFGLAGVTAGAAAYLFWREHARRTEHATIAPTVTKDSAGVSATFSF